MKITPYRLHRVHHKLIDNLYTLSHLPASSFLVHTIRLQTPQGISNSSKTRAILGAFVPTLFTATESRVAQAKLSRNLIQATGAWQEQNVFRSLDQSALCCIGYTQQRLATYSNIDINRSCYQDTLAGLQKIQNTTQKVYGKTLGHYR